MWHYCTCAKMGSLHGDVDEAMVRFRLGQWRLWRDWMRISKHKFKTKYEYTALDS